MSASLAETVQGEWVTLAQAIAPSTYRSTVKDVFTSWVDLKTLTRFPAVCVLMGTERLVAKDTSAAAWDSEIDFMLLGYAKQTDHEALCHDLKRVVADNMQAQITGAAPRWRVMKVRPITVTRSLSSEKDVYWMSIQFTVSLFAQSTSF